ncbi:hypothetical protein B0H19DRAFT_1066454 [Mycena capillaripes]|nr:hypothetical protein B0H19DRAFT_1066454 [Mycena capillaripes]
MPSDSTGTAELSGRVTHKSIKSGIRMALGNRNTQDIKPALGYTIKTLGVPHPSTRLSPRGYGMEGIAVRAKRTAAEAKDFILTFSVVVIWAFKTTGFGMAPFVGVRIYSIQDILPSECPTDDLW